MCCMFDVFICRLLLNNGADPLAATKSGKTSLSMAVTAGQVKAAEIILRNNPNLVNFTDQGGSTPLSISIFIYKSVGL
jgi:ankyrin repeat protein